MPVRLYEELYHMTHVDNLRGIRAHGLLSKQQMMSRGLKGVDISDPDVQQRRDRKLEPVFGRSIHEYVPLYFNPKNAMLSARREHQPNIAILVISMMRAMKNSVYLFTDGNAASGATTFGIGLETAKMSDIVLKANYWKEFPDGTRQRCAEMLVHEHIASSSIGRAHCFSKETCNAVRNYLECQAIIDRSMFY